MTSKQRAYLKGLAMKIDPIFQIGKSSVTPELTAAVAEALEARAHQAERSEKLSGRRQFHRGRISRENPFPGSPGNRKENRSLQAC